MRLETGLSTYKSLVRVGTHYSACSCESRRESAVAQRSRALQFRQSAPRMHRNPAILGKTPHRAVCMRRLYSVSGELVTPDQVSELN